MNDREFEETLNGEISKLKREIKPTRDLWPGIDYSINSNTMEISKPLALAACVILSVSLVISGNLYFSQQETGS